jgi:hypothetical protein
MSRSTLAVLASAAVLLSCAKAAEAPPAAPAPKVAHDVALPDHGWAMVDSPRFFVRVPLPDAAAWHVDDASGRWLVATHVPTKSMLWVRSWREGSVVSHSQCEAEARRLQPELFGKDESALVDRRPLGAPPGFDTEAAFSVHRAKGALGGVAVAVGANVRRCLVAAYATRAEGADAERALAERLDFVVRRIFARLENRGVEDRAGAVEQR